MRHDPLRSWTQGSGARLFHLPGRGRGPRQAMAGRSQVLSVPRHTPLLRTLMCDIVLSVIEDHLHTDGICKSESIYRFGKIWTYSVIIITSVLLFIQPVMLLYFMSINPFDVYKKLHIVCSSSLSSKYLLLYPVVRVCNGVLPTLQALHSLRRCLADMISRF
jgi:hypothetical protein